MQPRWGMDIKKVGTGLDIRFFCFSLFAEHSDQLGVWVFFFIIMGVFAFAYTARSWAFFWHPLFCFVFDEALLFDDIDTITFLYYLFISVRLFFFCNFGVGAGGQNTLSGVGDMYFFYYVTKSFFGI